MGENGPGEGQLRFDVSDDNSQQDDVKQADEKKPETTAPVEHEPGVEEIAWDKFMKRTFRSTGIEGNFFDHIEQLKKLIETQGENGISVKVERDRLQKIFLDTFQEKNEREALVQKLQKELKGKKAALAEASEKYDTQDQSGPVYGNNYEQARMVYERYEAALEYVTHSEEMVAAREKRTEEIKAEALRIFETTELISAFKGAGWNQTLRQISEYVAKMNPRLNPETKRGEFEQLQEELQGVLKKYLDKEQQEALVRALMEKASISSAAYEEVQHKKDHGEEIGSQTLANAKYRYEQDSQLFELIRSNLMTDEFRA